MERILAAVFMVLAGTSSYLSFVLFENGNGAWVEAARVETLQREQELRALLIERMRKMEMEQVRLSPTHVYSLETLTEKTMAHIPNFLYNDSADMVLGSSENVELAVEILPGGQMINLDKTPRTPDEQMMIFYDLINQVEDDEVSVRVLAYLDEKRGVLAFFITQPTNPELWHSVVMTSVKNVYAPDKNGMALVDHDDHSRQVTFRLNAVQVFPVTTLKQWIIAVDAFSYLGYGLVPEASRVAMILEDKDFMKRYRLPLSTPHGPEKAVPVAVFICLAFTALFLLLAAWFELQIVQQVQSLVRFYREPLLEAQKRGLQVEEARHSFWKLLFVSEERLNRVRDGCERVRAALEKALEAEELANRPAPPIPVARIALRPVRVEEIQKPPEPPPTEDELKQKAEELERRVWDPSVAADYRKLALDDIERALAILKDEGRPRHVLKILKHAEMTLADAARDPVRLTPSTRQPS